MRGLVWFKKDLRVRDNPALHQACTQCKDGVAAVYVIDHSMWQKNGTAACQIEFIFRGLESLASSLAELGISLFILETKSTAALPQLLEKLCQQIQAEKCFFNREWEVNEMRRDVAVVTHLNTRKLACEVYEDQLILPREKFYADRKAAFKVFTPFKRHWIKNFELTPALGKPKVKNALSLHPPAPPTLDLKSPSSINPALWPAGEEAAQKRLRDFVKQHLFSYHELRDYPEHDATSKLSPYLALGMISARACFAEALEANRMELDSGNQGALTWMSELIWREFYRHILMAEPRVCMNRAYKPETENLPWVYDEKLLQAWQQGQTGFPIVDAAMRQLNSMGWMHNRLRMVTAMFLAKNLFLDWRLGEAYFAAQLIDGDFASNNGGWQWSASTGTDAVPYFRLFNPCTQGQRFDAQGHFIRRYCPELSPLDNRAIHAPYTYAPDIARKIGYPRPIIDYAQSRQRCLTAFKSLKKNK